jgi:actin-related protein
MAERLPTIVIDHGSAFLRAGLAGTNSPSVVFPPVVGRSTPTNPASASLLEDGIVGQQVYDEKMPYLYSAVTHGQVSNFDALERILSHCFSAALRVDVREHQVLLSQSPLMRNNELEHTTEILFEKFSAGGAYFANSAVLVLLAYGRLSGVVLECGNHFSSATPVYDGHAVRAGCSIQPVCGGEQLDRYLSSILVQKGYKNLRWADEKLLMRKIKENLCYVARNPVDEESIEDSMTLPDQSVLTLGKERFMVTEALFQPSVLGTQARGIVQTLESAIFNPANVDRELQPILCSNIAIAGGSTLFKGFSQRLEWDIMSNLPYKMNPKLLSDIGIRRDLLTWTGGSILGSMPHFSDLCISRLEYDEFGPYVASLKCV